MKKANLLIAGVGGQGGIRASHILARAAIKDGLKVRVGETYGAAMRGGPVASHVRVGEGVHSPLNLENGADVVLALEPMEGLRNAIEFLSRDGLFLTNTETWIPYDVNIGKAGYPPVDDILRVVKSTGAEVISFNATSLARKAGEIKTINVVMLGALASTEKFPIAAGKLKETVEENVPEGTEDVNIRAFELGCEAI